MSLYKCITELKKLFEADDLTGSIWGSHPPPRSIFKAATQAQVADRPAPPPEADRFVNAWTNQLKQIIDDYKDGNTDPLDGDEADRLGDILRLKINMMEGNMTEEEYLRELDR